MRRHPSDGECRRNSVFDEKAKQELFHWVQSRI